MLLDDIKTRLIAQGVANLTTWKCFIGYAPDAQNQLISLHYTGGGRQTTMDGEVNEEYFQVRVRAAKRDYITCESKWREVFNALQDASPTVISNVYLIQAEQAGPMEYYDSLERPNMTANFRVIRARP